MVVKFTRSGLCDDRWPSGVHDSVGPLGRRIRREEVLHALLAKSAGSLVCGSCFRHRRTRTARDKLHGTDLQYR